MDEETYTLKMIEKYLVKSGMEDLRILPGNDPPDYDVYIDKKRYALEITNAETINSNNQKRREFSEPLLDLCDVANKSEKLSKIVGKNRTLLIHVNCKIQEFRKFKNLLINPKPNDLNAYIASLSIFPEVNIKVTSNYVDKKRVEFIIGDRGDDLDIQRQISRIVQNIFIKKKEKMDKGNISDARWLGIKINHFFDGRVNWEQGINDLQSNYGFSRAFFVNHAGDIYDCKL
ncbi:MAG TPA: hypothetical protein PL121_01270 [bacterium]|nr:hypothetical protein [bacterium]HQG78882.1 hypothetical protein [bacterium]HQK63436.1 hypothetical protein [Methanofastidiosum sp.]